MFQGICHKDAGYIFVEGQEVENVRHVDPLALELLEDRVQVLDAAVDGALDAVGLEELAEHPLDLGKPSIGRLPAILDLKVAAEGKPAQNESAVEPAAATEDDAR